MGRPAIIRLNPHKLHVHACDPKDGTIRLWRSDNPGDVFDVVSEEAWATMRKIYPLPITKGFPEADDGTLTCSICIRNRMKR